MRHKLFENTHNKDYSALSRILQEYLLFPIHSCLVFIIVYLLIQGDSNV